MTKKELLKLAKKRGIKVMHGDPKKARPLSEICGKLKSNNPAEDWIRFIRCNWIDITGI